MPEILDFRNCLIMVRLEPSVYLYHLQEFSWLCNVDILFLTVPTDHCSPSHPSPLSLESGTASSLLSRSVGDLLDLASCSVLVTPTLHLTSITTSNRYFIMASLLLLNSFNTSLSPNWAPPPSVGGDLWRSCLCLYYEAGWWLASQVDILGVSQYCHLSDTVL